MLKIHQQSKPNGYCGCKLVKMFDIRVSSTDDEGTMWLAPVPKKGGDYGDSLGKMACRSREHKENVSVTICVFT